MSSVVGQTSLDCCKTLVFTLRPIRSFPRNHYISLRNALSGCGRLTDKWSMLRVNFRDHTLRPTHPFFAKTLIATRKTKPLNITQLVAFPSREPEIPILRVLAFLPLKIAFDNDIRSRHPGKGQVYKGLCSQS